MMVPWWRPQSYYDDPGRGMLARDGGGVLITQAIHSLDLFRWLVGIDRVEAAQVRTTALHRMETEDYAAALVRLATVRPARSSRRSPRIPAAPNGSTSSAREAPRALNAVACDVSSGRAREKIADNSGSGSGASVMAFSHDAHPTRSAISSTRSSRDASRRFPARKHWRPSG